jgi:hypothetical protein
VVLFSCWNHTRFDHALFWSDAMNNQQEKKPIPGTDTKTVIMSLFNFGLIIFGTLFLLGSCAGAYMSVQGPAYASGGSKLVTVGSFFAIIIGVSYFFSGSSKADVDKKDEQDEKNI